MQSVWWMTYAHTHCSDWDHSLAVYIYGMYYGFCLKVFWLWPPDQGRSTTYKKNMMKRRPSQGAHAVSSWRRPQMACECPAGGSPSPNFLHGHLKVCMLYGGWGKYQTWSDWNLCFNQHIQLMLWDNQQPARFRLGLRRKKLYPSLRGLSLILTRESMTNGSCLARHAIVYDILRHPYLLQSALSCGEWSMVWLPAFWCAWEGTSEMLPTFMKAMFSEDTLQVPSVEWYHPCTVLTLSKLVTLRAHISSPKSCQHIFSKKSCRLLLQDGINWARSFWPKPLCFQS